MFGNTTKNEALLSRIVPEYWDDKVLAIDEILCAEQSPKTNKQFARDALEHKIASLYGQPYRPLKRYGAGDYFDVNEQAAGTVIRMRREKASSRIPTSVFSDVPAAELPSTNLSRDIGHTLKARDAWYDLSDFWGIVVPVSDGQQALVGANDCSIKKGYEAQIYPFSLAAFSSQFKVGTVYGAPGLRRQATVKNMYVRYLAVDEVGPSGYKKRQFVRELLENILPKPTPVLQPIPVKE